MKNFVVPLFFEISQKSKTIFDVFKNINGQKHVKKQALFQEYVLQKELDFFVLPPTT